MNWIKNEIKLSGETVEIIPMAKEHFDEIIRLANDKRIWEFYPYNCMDTIRLRELLDLALTEREKGIQFPFVIIHKKENRIIGSTRFLDIQMQHKKLEIGWTWLHPDYWATEINFECKLILLTYCFEELKLKRVFFRTNEHNLRSQKAIQKIGAKYEGTLRNDIMKDDGTMRTTVFFSILDNEWQDVKQELTLKYLNRKNYEQTTSL